MVKIKKIKPMLIMAVIILILGVSFSFLSASAKPVTDVKPAAESFDYNKIDKILSLNRVFDDALLIDDRCLIEEAAIVLLDRSVLYEDNGYSIIKAEDILNFCRNVYSREVDLTAAVYNELPAPVGYVAVLPRCYCEYKNASIKATYSDDGNIVVTSKLYVIMDEVSCFDLTTVLKANPESDFGYSIISATMK